CGFSTETRTGLAIPGLGDHRPRGAFVRFVPGGTFEEVTTYLGIIHALRELGVKVWDDGRAVVPCVGKSQTRVLSLSLASRDGRRRSFCRTMASRRREPGPG